MKFDTKKSLTQTQFRNSYLKDGSKKLVPILDVFATVEGNEVDEHSRHRYTPGRKKMSFYERSQGKNS
jgi:hypothetical protein